MTTPSKPFDAVLGNPPFIRYQYLDDLDQQRMRKIFNARALPFTGHTNAWVPFVLLAIDCLKPGGRLAMVVPAEILHVLYAEPLRQFISTNCSRALVIDTRRALVQRALQGVVLMLAEKKSPDANAQPGIALASVASREFLGEDPEAQFEHARFTNADDLKGKWTRALLNDRERSLLDGVAQPPGRLSVPTDRKRRCRHSYRR